MDEEYGAIFFLIVLLCAIVFGIWWATKPPSKSSIESYLSNQKQYYIDLDSPENSALYEKHKKAGSKHNIATLIMNEHKLNFKMKLRAIKKKKQAESLGIKDTVVQADTTKELELVKKTEYDAIKRKYDIALNVADSLNKALQTKVVDTVTIVDTLFVKDTVKVFLNTPPEKTYKKITDDVYLFFHGAKVLSVLEGLEEIKTKTGKIEYSVEDSELTDGIIIKMEF